MKENGVRLIPVVSKLLQKWIYLFFLVKLHKMAK